MLNTDPINGTWGQVASTMSIQLAFSLSAGGDAGVNGLFLVTPAPGSVALIGLGLIVGRRRRRRE